MNVYTCKHDGHYLGGYSVVVAHDEAEARELLAAELRSHGLNLEPSATVESLPLTEARAVVLFNGDY